MSYVLDALRKSEQERQLASRQVASILCPVMVEPRRGWQGFFQTLAGTSGIVGFVAIVLALGSWSWWRSSVRDSSFTSANTVVTTTLPLTAQVEPVKVLMPQPKTANPTVNPIVPPAFALPALTETSATPPPQRVAKTIDAPGTTTPTVTVQPAPSTATAANKSEPVTEPVPKDLPPLEIAGYIQDEQGATLAMINDKLVREGDEVAPGLRLEKILGASSIFSYKGYRFRR